MRRWILALALVFAVPAADALGVREAGDWTAICDNVRHCTAFLTSQNRAADRKKEAAAYFRIERSGESDGATEVELIAPGEAFNRWSVHIDGRRASGISPFKLQYDIDWPENADPGPGFFFWHVPTAETAVLLRAMRKGHRLTVESADGTTFDFDLSSASVALGFIDDQQMRTGTATALWAPRQRVETVPPIPVLPTIVVDPKVNQNNLPPAKEEILAQVRDKTCHGGAIGTPITQRLAPNTILWEVGCHGEDEVSDVFVGDEATGTYHVVDLPAPPDIDPSHFRATLAGQSSDPRIVGNFPWGTFCGRAVDWIWSGNAFILEDVYLVLDCKGILPNDRPFVYRARIVEKAN